MNSTNNAKLLRRLNYYELSLRWKSSQKNQDGDYLENNPLIKTIRE